MVGKPIQQKQYLPIRQAQGNAYGESFINQRVNQYDARYTFSGKEKDLETDYGYFGAHYYHSDISLWLSMYPMAKKKKKPSNLPTISKIASARKNGEPALAVNAKNIENQKRRLRLGLAPLLF